jgi:flavin reductase (DIM6/NTAB) family NADH-FMN oxidoreductase RutF/pimeloyl-ACP methyl ester carboxylesterase
VAALTFKGFAGVRLQATSLGLPDDPAVLLVHGSGQTAAIWAEAAEALAAAGRHVISLDLRGHGDSEWPADGRYDFDAFVEDMRAVLAQLPKRPVIVAASLGGWIATAALKNDAAQLASGLVLVDVPTEISPDASQTLDGELRARLAATPGKPTWDVRLLDQFEMTGIADRLIEAAPTIPVPMMFMRGASSRLVSEAHAANLVSTFPSGEVVSVEDEDLLISTDRTEIFNALLLDFLESKQPRFVPEYREGSDARTFRDALGCFATGVTIVTAMNDAGEPIGLTANSFTSVSLDPPLLLVCVANSSSSAAVMRTTKRFAVNVLQIGQQPTSNRFAGKGEDRFANTPWEVGEFGTPVLSGSLASFECERDALHDGGDHFILVGRVLKAMFEPRRDPLLYFRGKYRRLHFA